MRKLFGTDGIRAVAGQSPLDKRTIFAVGVALAHHISSPGGQPRVVLGMDTRESSEWIAAVITAGLKHGGAAVESGRRHHDAGGGIPGAGARLRRGHRHLGVAQSVAGQRHQGLRARRLQAAGCDRARH